jgi:hypothetical protein
MNAPSFCAMKHKRILNSIIAVIGYIAVAWLAFVRPDWLLMFGIFTAIPGYLLLLICFTPLGGVTLGDRSLRLPFMSWVAKLCKAQLAMLIFTIAAAVAFLGAGPQFASGAIPLSFVSDMIKDYSRWQWGIFPWGIYGIWALIIAYITYIKKGSPYFYQLARSTWSKRLDPMIKTFIEGTTSGATIMVFTLVATTIILLLVYIFEIYTRHNHFAMPFITFTVVTLVTPLITLPTGRKLFKKIAARGGTLTHIYGLLIIFLVTILVVAGFANSYVIMKHPELYNMQCKQCGNYFMNVPLEARFAALYWGWWLLWTPIAGSYLAKISIGRSLREFVIGLFILPLIIFILGYHYGTAPFAWILISVQKLTGSKAILLACLGILTWICFTRITNGIRTTSIFYAGLMPLPATERQNRLWLKDGSKTQGFSKVGQKLWLSVIGTIFLHTVGGWYGIQIQVAAMAVLVINAVYAGFDFLFYRLIKDRAWIGNRNIPPFE